MLKRSFLARLRGRLAHGAHAHPQLGEAELLARTDEFNRNAERHWSEIAAEPEGRKHPLNKPLSTVRDTPSIFYRLGLALDALEPGVGHTVLDFGSGSCWLSSLLNRLRCRTIAVDVSPSALGLGRELFAMDSRHLPELEPQFLAYDGRRIALADASVDRIICFDAFHHVPNQDEALAELYRVLRPGGRAVFAEPGEGHSHTDESACEVERCGILENDFDVADFLERAARVGFGEATVKPYPDVHITLPAPAYLDFMRGSNRIYPVSHVREQMRTFHVLSLPKGSQTRDSRNPGAFVARIQVPAKHLTLRGHGAVTLPVPVRLTNAGDTLWLSERDLAGGFVELGAFLFSEAGELLSRGLTRAALPRPVAPGETVELTLMVPLPAKPGRYRARLDIVDEFVTWGAHHGSETPELELVVEEYGDSRDPHQLCARIERKDSGAELVTAPGAPVRLPLRIVNVGDTLWQPAPLGARGTVSVGGQLHDASGALVAKDFFRSPLPAPAAPGDALELDCVFAAPPEPGRYELRIDLVAEGILWFANHGSTVVPVSLRVTDETPTSEHPGVLRARVAASEAILRAQPRQLCRISVRLENTGNTLWLHSPDKRHGHVALGARLRDAEGGLLEAELLRAPLPHDVAPGRTAELIAELRAPERPGRYRLELDLVDEGIAWFAQRGSASAEVELFVE